MENDFTLKKLHLEPFRKYLQTEIGRGAAAPLSEATNTFYMYTKDDLEDAPDGVSVAAITEQWKPRSGSTPSLAPRPAAFSPVTPSTPPGARLESAWKSPAATYAFSQRPQVSERRGLSCKCPASVFPLELGTQHDVVAPHSGKGCGDELAPAMCACRIARRCARQHYCAPPVRCDVIAPSQTHKCIMC